MDAPRMSPPLLECLDALARLEREKPPARLASLATRLGLDRAAATERVDALEAQGLVRTDRSGRIVLVYIIKYRVDLVLLTYIISIQHRFLPDYYLFRFAERLAGELIYHLV